MKNRKGANHVTNTFVVGSAWIHGNSLYRKIVRVNGNEPQSNIIIYLFIYFVFLQ